MMKSLKILILSFAIIAIPIIGYAQISDSCEIYRDARKVIQDYNKVVSPTDIDETFNAEVGGLKQWISVKGQDKDNPLLLFIHGGPASPLSPVSWLYQKPLEEYFTVANYDQRFAGKTFGLNDTLSFKNNVTIDQYVADAITISELLLKKYHKQHLILVGHSWGTVVATKAVLEKPGLFAAYVGIGQVVDMLANENLGFEYAMKMAFQEKNEKAIAELKSIAPYPGKQPITRERLIIARKWPQYYGGFLAYRKNFYYFFNAPILSPDYSKADIENIDKGNLFTLGRLIPELMAFDLSKVGKFPIPIIMLYGRHDYTTPTAPVEKWMKTLKAPYKKEIWFENSSHMIPFEEPGKFLITLVNEVGPLKDKKH